MGHIVSRERGQDLARGQSGGYLPKQAVLALLDSEGVQDSVSADFKVSKARAQEDGCMRRSMREILVRS